MRGGLVVLTEEALAAGDAFFVDLGAGGAYAVGVELHLIGCALRGGEGLAPYVGVEAAETLRGFGPRGHLAVV